MALVGQYLAGWLFGHHSGCAFAFGDNFSNLAPEAGNSWRLRLWLTVGR